MRANKALIICVHIRPETDKALSKALKKRKAFVGKNDDPYYAVHAKDSILEDYSKSEIKEILKKIGLKHNLKFVKDYYERCLITLEK